MSDIHQTAVVHPKAIIKEGVKIGPYVVIASPDVILEEEVELKAHVYIEGRVRIKRKTIIYPFTSIGTPPQHLTNRGGRGWIEIGESCEIRESVTINASCSDEEGPKIGDHCFLMAYSHIGHNCKVGSHVTMANGATLGGYVHVGDYVFLGGGCAIHQHCKIGDYAMIGGGCMTANDVPPYTLTSGYPLELVGLNRIGLKRRGFEHETLMNLLRAYRITFYSGLSWEKAREEILTTLTMDPYLQKWIDFCDTSKRGLAPVREKKQVHQRKEAVYVG